MKRHLRSVFQFQILAKRSLSNTAAMTVKRVQAPFGRWESPISVDLLTGSAVAISEFKAHGKNDLYFLESRPFEQGRSVLVKMNGEGKTTDVIGPEVNVRTKVHEYGGGAFAIDSPKKDRGLFYSDFADDRLYHASDISRPLETRPIGPDNSNLRYANMNIHPEKDLFVAVCEDHTNDTPSEVRNFLVLMEFGKKSQWTKLVKGADFYSNPTFSPDGKTLIWKQWNHPEMPWTTSELFAADFTSSPQGVHSLSNVRKVAGGSANYRVAVTQPSFLPTGALVFCSDETGYQQLYESLPPYQSASLITKALQGDFAGNDWRFGNSSYTIVPDKDELIATYTSPKGMPLLARIGLKTGILESIQHPFCTIDGIEGNSDFPELLYITGSTKDTTGLFSFYAKNGDLKVLKSSLKTTEIDPSYLSQAQPFEIPIDSSFPQPRKTFGFYYAPTSPTHETDSPKSAPPLIMRIHGGPTSAAQPVTSLQISYWTSRGYAFFALNYGGSSGFGKKYMDSLNSHWGVLDSQDAEEAAIWLARHGYCDASKIAIDGGSAGGYTVLNVMCHSNVFAAGISLYGISELNALANDTHKFESQYLFNLIGGTPAEIPDTYHARSPLFHAKKIKTPVMIQQGTEDRVVPINQAREMVREIEANGGIVELLVFEGEGHGFRGAKAQRESLEGETKFLEKYLKL